LATQSGNNGASQISAATVSWRLASFVTCIALIVLVFVNWESTAALVFLWSDSNRYSHGFLVVPVTAYLLWSQRSAVSKLPIRPSKLALAGLLPLAFLLWAAYVTDVQTILQICLILASIGTVWALLGLRVFLCLLFPLAYMLMAAPVWDVLAQPLQSLTALISAGILKLMGVPILLEGHYITIPEGRFVVQEYCSGLQYLLAGISVGLLFAYLHIHRLRPSTLFLGLVVIAAITANLIRVIAVIYAGHVTDMQHSLVADHRNLGWCKGGIEQIDGLLPQSFRRR